MNKLDDADRYFHLFRPLLNINEDTQLSEIFGGIDIQKPYAGLLSFIAISAPIQTAEKAIRGRIKEWSQQLDRLLEEVRLQSDRLGRLQELANTVFNGGKIAVLKGLLEKEDLKSPKTVQAIDRFEELVMRTIRAPKLDAPQKRHMFNQIPPILMRGGFGFPLHFNPFAFGGIQSAFIVPSIPRLPKKQAHPRIGRSCSSPNLTKISAKAEAKKETKKIGWDEIRKQTAQKQEELVLQKMAMDIMIYQPKFGNQWEMKLVACIKPIEDKKLLAALGPLLHTRQVFSLINFFISDETQAWKLVYVVGTIKHDVFLELLHSLTPELIRRVNVILKRAALEDSEWFNNAFSKQRDGFIKYCNEMKDEIDGLASVFRQDVRGHNITSGNLRTIDEFRDNMMLRLTGIEVHLKPLLDGVLLRDNTRAIFFEQLVEEYRVLLDRLSERSSRFPPGSLWPTIYSSVFKDNDLDDEDDAVLALGAWSVLTAEECRNVGLLGEISDEQFDLLKQKEVQAQKDLKNFKITGLAGIENLKRLGIELIGDWKKVKVFNAGMLMEFLYREENRIKLTGWTLEALANEK